MKTRNNRNKSNLSIAIIWFLVISCGIAYSSTGDTGINVAPIAGVSLAAGPMRTALNAISARGAGIAGNVAGAAGILALHANSEGDRATKHRDTLAKVTAYVKDMAGSRLMTASAAKILKSEIQENQALAQLDAATEAYANALTITILKRFEGKTKEEVIATYIEDGRRYGFIAPDPLRLSSNDSGKSFSLVSKAFASTGRSGNDIQCPPSGSNEMQRGDTTGMRADGTYPGPPTNQAVAVVQCGVYEAEGVVVAGVMDEGGDRECGQDGKDAKCNEPVARHKIATDKSAKGVGKIAKHISQHSVITPASGGQAQGLNFFISPAYAADQSTLSTTSAATAQFQKEACNIVIGNGQGTAAGCTTPPSGSADNSPSFISKAYASVSGQSSSAYLHNARDNSVGESEQYAGSLMGGDVVPAEELTRMVLKHKSHLPDSE